MGDKLKPIAKQKPEDVAGTAVKKVAKGKINKTAILYSAAGFLFFVMLTMTIKPDTKKEVKEEMAMAVSAQPDFKTALAAAQSGKPKPETKQPSPSKEVSVTRAKSSGTAQPAYPQPPAPKVGKAEQPRSVEKVKPLEYKKIDTPVPSYTDSEVYLSDEAARKSPLIAGSFKGDYATGTTGDSVRSPFYGEPTSGLVGFNTAQPGTQQPTRAEQYRDWNDQAGKQAFKGEATEGGAAATLPIQPQNTVVAGTILPAVMLTGVNTDLPGDIMALVTEGIYDSVTGDNLLIPQGSKLLARYNSSVSWGQNRVQIVWERLIRPDGVSIDLGAMNGVDARGYAGNKARVNEHPLKVMGGLGMMAAVSMIAGQTEYTAKKITPAGAEIVSTVGDALQEVGASYVERAMNVQPTLTVKPGTKVQVFVNVDLYFPEAPQKGIPNKYQIGGKP